MTTRMLTLPPVIGSQSLVRTCPPHQSFPPLFLRASSTHDEGEPRGYDSLASEPHKICLQYHAFSLLVRNSCGTNTMYEESGDNWVLKRLVYLVIYAY